jgi:esterase/lipase superfamily enzyme
MHRDYTRWYSPSLGRDMEMLVFGHAGARAVVFPTSMGRFFEWEDRGMVAALDDAIGQGWLQLFCIDSVDSESWYARWKHPHDRARHHQAFDHYLEHELLPYTAHRNPNPFLILTGASFGAYHAAFFALKHPHLVGRMLGMSGLYDIKRQTDGYTDEAVYFTNPADFVQHEHDHARLEAMRRMDIILAVGRDDPNIAENERFSQLLWQKAIPHALRVWDGWAHDWPWWREMARKYIHGHD